MADFSKTFDVEKTAVELAELTKINDDGGECISVLSVSMARLFADGYFRFIQPPKPPPIPLPLMSPGTIPSVPKRHNKTPSTPNQP